MGKKQENAKVHIKRTATTAAVATPAPTAKSKAPAMLTEEETKESELAAKVAALESTVSQFSANRGRKIAELLARIDELQAQLDAQAEQRTQETTSRQEEIAALYRTIEAQQKALHEKESELQARDSAWAQKLDNQLKVGKHQAAHLAELGVRIKQGETASQNYAARVETLERQTAEYLPAQLAELRAEATYAVDQLSNATARTQEDIKELRQNQTNIFSHANIKKITNLVLEELAKGMDNASTLRRASILSASPSNEVQAEYNTENFVYDTEALTKAANENALAQEEGYEDIGQDTILTEDEYQGMAEAKSPAGDSEKAAEPEGKFVSQLEAERAGNKTSGWGRFWG